MDGRSRCVPSSTDAVSSMKLKHEKMNLNLKESVCQNRYPASSNQKFVVQMKSSSLFVLRSSKVLERLLSGVKLRPITEGQMFSLHAMTLEVLRM